MNVDYLVWIPWLIGIAVIHIAILTLIALLILPFSPLLDKIDEVWWAFIFIALVFCGVQFAHAFYDQFLALPESRQMHREDPRYPKPEQVDRYSSAYFRRQVAAGLLPEGYSIECTSPLQTICPRHVVELPVLGSGCIDFRRAA